MTSRISIAPPSMPARRAWWTAGAHALAVTGLLQALPAAAADIELPNPDFKLRWDNTVRYSLGQRLQNRSELIDRAGGFSFDQSNALFDKGDLITNRVDLLTELDASYQSRFGARLTAAAWYDDAYGNFAAATSRPTAYVNNEFTPVVKRYYRHSGELLDAYVYGRVDAGAVPIDVRLGKHAVIWGEGLFGSTNSVAYSQAPSDSRKATANPGASAKETALPIAQVSAIAQFTDELVLSGQYTFRWAPNRLPEGGTFFAGADTILDGPNVGRGPAVEGDRGDIGLSLRWRPQWIDGTLGAYYRRFDEKSSWTSQLNPATNLRGPVYAKDVEIVGLSLATLLGGISVGTEVSYRKNMPLNSRGAAGDRLEGAKGETLHALVNGVITYGSSPLFASASLSGELAWSHLVKVTSNPALYRTAGSSAAVGCVTEDIVGGCSTRNFYSAGVSFIPVWTQVFPSTDIRLPIFVSANLKGNAPTNGGGSEGFKTYRMALQAEAYARHNFELAATYYAQKVDEARGLVLGAPYKDKAWLSFTYQTTF